MTTIGITSLRRGDWIRMSFGNSAINFNCYVTGVIGDEIEFGSPEWRNDAREKINLTNHYSKVLFLGRTPVNPFWRLFRWTRLPCPFLRPHGVMLSQFNPEVVV